MNNPWTKDEVKKFRELYPTHTNHEMEEYFPNHTFKSVESLGYRLGLKKDSSFRSAVTAQNNMARKEVTEMNLEKVNELELLEEISRRGFQSTRREILLDRINNFHRKLKPFKLGVISETHFGSQ